MIYRPLGQSGITASVVAHGTWAIGGWMWGGTDVQKSVRSIQASLDAGVNFIDTAPAYGLGLSERIVGEAIRGRRDKVILATKCGLVWHTAKGTFFVDQNGTRIHRYLGAESIRYEVEQSLRRLETDYIDLYQTHWQDPTTPIEETMGTLLDLKKQGKIRAIGVSNCTLDQVRQYRSVGPVDTAQEQYSMLHRELERRIPAVLRAEQHRRAGVLAAGQRAADRQGRSGARLPGGRFAPRQPDVQPRVAHSRKGNARSACGRWRRSTASRTASW